MPKKINLIGYTYGKLTVINEAPSKNKKTYWLCQCECGNQKEIRADFLKDGSIKSCGCLKKEGLQLTGQRFGKLTALYDTGKKNGTNKIWHFKCDCGNEIDLDTSHLKSKHDLSCGCGYSPIKDISNQKFGMLTVIEDTGKRASDGSVIWKCKCDCGNDTEVSSNNLTRLHTYSCGCIKSQGEEKIAKILKENNISFIREKTFADCKDKKPLKFDFYLPDYHKCIEYDGIFHFKITNRTTKENLEAQQKRDKIKNNFCYKNNIPLLRISYLEFNNITLERLLNEITKLEED